MAIGGKAVVQNIDKKNKRRMKRKSKSHHGQDDVAGVKSDPSRRNIFIILAFFLMGGVLVFTLR